MYDEPNIYIGLENVSVASVISSKNFSSGKLLIILYGEWGKIILYFFSNTNKKFQHINLKLITERKLNEKNF